MSTYEFVRGFYLSRLVDRVDLHAGWAGLSAFADGRVYGATGGFAPGFRIARADRYTSSGKIAGEFMAGIPRVSLACCLRRIRPRLHRGRHVSHSGAPTQNTSVAFDFLSSSAANRSFCGDHAVALVGFRALYAWAGEWLFYRPTVAARANGLRIWGLDPIRGDFARQTSAPARAETCSRPQHSGI